MPKITLCYRRAADSIAIAGRIYDRLVEHYGKDAVFMDVDGIPLGVDVREFIDGTLRETKVVIALVAPSWLACDEGGKAAIEAADDPVRVEIETALRAGLVVVPLLVGQTTMPKPQELPESLNAFAYLNAAQVDPGRDFHAHVNRLIAVLDAQLGMHGLEAPASGGGRPATPSGTVTFVFAEIEDAAGHWERDPGAMQAAVQRCDALVREALEGASGYVFETVSDSFRAAFSRPEDAATAALALQRGVGAEDFSAVGGLAVRVALHTGTSDECDGGYAGATINRAVRLLGIAYGGQVLVSGTTAELLRGGLAEEATLTDLGAHRLRDLMQPEMVYQLCAPGLRREFPPLRSLAALPNNLPLQITDLIGRDAEVAEIVALLGAHRLVTIIGAGGVGKTRVTLQAGADLLDGSAGGVWFVELAPLADGAFVPSAIALALGTELAGRAEPLTALVVALKHQRLLLILDNCEHLIDGVARVAHAILRDCPGVSILASSRQALGIAGEAPYRMPSLAFPTEEEEAGLTAEAARRYPAIALFEERATAVDKRFSLTDDDATIVAGIVRRLDGIPLAIELAAARVRVLAPRQLQRRLDERFRILTGGSRTALPRQQTLRALIDWSYDLLSDREKTILRRVAVFAGGWTLEAAEAVCADEEFDALDVLELLSSLVDKSLVIADPAGASTRYRMLESTRAYAGERLNDAGEADAGRLRHARWAAEFADQAFELNWKTARQVWREVVEDELDNMRRALEWALGANEFVLAGRIVGGLDSLWYDAGLGGEGRRWAESVLAHLDQDAHPLVAARVWATVGLLSVGKTKVEAATRAIEFSTRADARRELARDHSVLGFGLIQSGRNDEAATMIDRSLELYREAGCARSRRYATSLGYRAMLLGFGNRFDDARALYAEALALNRDLGEEWGNLWLLANLAELEFESGDAARAVHVAREAIGVIGRARLQREEPRLLANLAGYHLALGEVVEARTAALRSLQMARSGQQSHIVIAAVQHLGTVAALQSETRRAGLLLGYSDAWYRREGVERDHTERKSAELLAATLRRQLGEGEIATLATEGAELSEEQAADEAASVEQTEEASSASAA